MKIEVLSRSLEKKEFIEAVAAFYAEKLHIDKSRYSLKIHTISGLAKHDKINGSVMYLGNKQLLLSLESSLSSDKLLQTLAHEMVHVKQYAKGQLKVVYPKRGNPYFSWLGKKVKSNYYESPWELEAFSRERILANKVAQLIS